MDLTHVASKHLQRATILENVLVARGTWRLRLSCPVIAAVIRPGQFVMVRAVGRTDPLLARPYALYDVICDADGNARAIDIVYFVVGNGTRTLSQLRPAEEVDIWGPLGNSFPLEVPESSNGHLMVMAGGIGQTPFVAVCKQWLGKALYGGMQRDPVRKVTVAYGVRSKDYFAGLEDFEQSGATLRLATDDGSRGHHGFVTDLLIRELESDDPPTAIFSCGPEPMLAKVAEITKKYGVGCWVSLETKMACGYGVCFSCVCPVVESDGWDYRRVCLDGSIFSADCIAWQEL